MSTASQNDRRNFLKKAAVGSVAALSISEIVKAGIESSTKSSKVKIAENDVVLFQGDSITDAGRDRDVSEPNNNKALGSGYAFIATSDLLYKFPGKSLKMYNKGISGNKVFQLADRWDTDCLALKPNVLSILVGVNDYWHMKKHNYKGTIETYRNDYKALVQRTLEKLPDVKLIICEPFALAGISAVDESWFPAFDAYRAAAKEVADQFGAAFIPYQSILNKALNAAPGGYWLVDGVHPTIAGAQLMATAWMSVVK